MITTPSIASHLLELTSSLNLPVSVTSSKNSVMMANLAATLLSTLNWTHVEFVFAPFSSLLSLFGEAANKEHICIRQQTVIPQPKNRNWTITTNVKDMTHVAVVFGSISQIQQVIEATQRSDLLIQWVYVSLDLHQKSSSLGKLPKNTIILAPKEDMVKVTEENLKNFRSFLETNFTSSFNDRAITRNPFFFDILTTIANLSCKLRGLIEQHCYSSVSALCDKLPAFHELTSFTINNCSLADITMHNITDIMSDFSVQQIKPDSIVKLKNVGNFHVLYNEVKFIINDNASLLPNNSPHDLECERDSNRSECTSLCINFLQDSLNLQNSESVDLRDYVTMDLQDVQDHRNKDAVSHDNMNIHTSGSVPSVKNGILILHLSWRQDTWVAAIVSIAAVGLTCSIAITIFILVRICKGDALEGNPFFSFLLLLSIDCTYFSVIPFSLLPEEIFQRWLICGLRVFGTSISYALLFSIMLSRSFMLASCDKDGGLMSHINGYLQTVLCFFMVGVQAGLSVQFWFINSRFLNSNQCSSIYEGHMFLILLCYDMFLLLLLACMCSFIIRSKRNYSEGIFFTIATLLCVLVFVGWCTAYMLAPQKWRDAAITGGLTATATVILVTIFIPRTYLMMSAVVRDDLASALPSLSFMGASSVQDVNYQSSQVLYDTVGPNYAVQSQENVGQTSSVYCSDQPQPPMDLKAVSGKRSTEREHSEGSMSPECTYESLESITVRGLMIGVRDTIPKFLAHSWISTGLNKSTLLDIAVLALKVCE
ncbi:hypothetical protein C0J52_20196 [Blattella germanica]|nr:hypothetical protein C0J52_20196 [Blattella germanica]